MQSSMGDRLEQYTIKRPQEVLLITVEMDGQSDLIAIFKGYSSSLMHPTAFDPEVPVLPEGAKIIAIDRVKGPYNRDRPEYIQQGLTWEMMKPLLSDVGV